MAYKALYRVWRPQRFADVIGQDHVVRTLQNACRENRVAHAYLFSGPRGTGKTSVAKILAKAVNCSSGPTSEPCNQCAACIGITNGNIVDVVEIDAASNRGIEEIRNIREQVKYAPTEVQKKVYIIDEVHMLTTEAFNALLKTLEEPPAHVLFILATTEPHKLPLTIISRCQRFDFHRIRREEMVERMDYICQQEGITITPPALSFVAKIAAGGMRDALSLLDQAASIHQQQVELDHVLALTGSIPSYAISEMASAALQGDAKFLLERIDQLMMEGKDAEQLLQNTLQYYRDLMVYKLAPDLEEVKERIEQDENFPQIAAHYHERDLHNIVEALNTIMYSMKWTQFPQILLEIAYLKIVELTATPVESQPVQESSVMELNQRLEALENKIARLEQQGLGRANTSELNGKRKTKKETLKMQKRTGSSSLQTATKLQKFLQEYDPARTERMIQEWERVLLAIKERRIQAHAWLMNSDVVAVSGEEILLAFRHEIHRLTTEKKHKELIEQTIYDELGIPYKIVTTMQEDWEQAKANRRPNEAKTAVQDGGEPKEEPTSTSPLLQQIINMVGKDVIKTKK